MRIARALARYKVDLGVLKYGIGSSKHGKCVKEFTDGVYFTANEKFGSRNFKWTKNEHLIETLHNCNTYYERLSYAIEELLMKRPMSSWFVVLLK